MLSCFFALLIAGQKKPAPEPAFIPSPEVRASLERSREGEWSVVLRGPASPSDWMADPEALQLSLEPVGGGPGQAIPTLKFPHPEIAAKAEPVEGKPESVARIPVTIETAGGAPAFAFLRSNGFVLSVDPLSKKTLSIPVHSPERPTYLPAAIPPPKLEPGLRFFYLPDRRLDLRDEKGAPVPFESASLHELRLEKIDMLDEGRFSAQFRLEGWPTTVKLEGAGDPLKIPGLPPIVWDDGARQLRNNFQGKPAWVYGGMVAGVTDTPLEWVGVRVGVVQPIRIAKILRLYTRSVPLNAGPQIAALGGETNSTFLADCPIYVLTDLAGKGQITAAMGESADDMSKIFRQKVKIRGFQVVADAWQFERVFSLKSGMAQHPDWPSDLHQSVLDGKLRKGMSHAMVAWAMGWPCEPGTKKEMMKWPKWRYDIVSPYNFWVYFEGDRVVNFGEDRRRTD